MNFQKSYIILKSLHFSEVQALLLNAIAYSKVNEISGAIIEKIKLTAHT